MRVRSALFPISLLCVLPAFGKRTLQYIEHSNALDRNLVCNDGTPGGYYISRAPTDATEVEKNTWVFHQEGGGWCWNNTACVERITNFENDPESNHLISSDNWPSELEFEGGILDMTPGTALARANSIFLPFCSSDAHLSNTTREVVFDDAGLDVRTIEFRGKHLAFTTILELVGDLEDQTVIFGGFSAGGRGSMVTIDQLRSLLPASTKLYGTHDSPAYLDIEPLHPERTGFGEQCRLFYYYLQPEISETCQELYPSEDDRWKCVTGEFVLPIVDTPGQTVPYLYDSYQVGSNIGSEPEDWSASDCQFADDPFRKRMTALAEKIRDSDSQVVFAPACYRHGDQSTSVFQSIKVDGVSAEDQLLKFIFDDVRESHISVCDGVNCEPTCPAVEVSKNCDANGNPVHGISLLAIFVSILIAVY